MHDPLPEARQVTADLNPGNHPEPSRLEQILQRHYPGLIRLLIRRARSHADALDVLHEAIRITIEHHARGRIAYIEQLPGYVFRTALNLLRNHRRAMCNRPELRTPHDSIDTLEARALPDTMDAEVMADEVRHALEELQMKRDRVIITRFYLEEHDKADICRDLSISSTHFDKVVFRARRRMRESLAERGISEFGQLGA